MNGSTDKSCNKNSTDDFLNENIKGLPSKHLKVSTDKIANDFRFKNIAMGNVNIPTE